MSPLQPRCDLSLALLSPRSTRPSHFSDTKASLSVNGATSVSIGSGVVFSGTGTSSHLWHSLIHLPKWSVSDLFTQTPGFIGTVGYMSGFFFSGEQKTVAHCLSSSQMPLKVIWGWGSVAVCVENSCITCASSHRLQWKRSLLLLPHSKGEC